MDIPDDFETYHISALIIVSTSALDVNSCNEVTSKQTITNPSDLHRSLLFIPYPTTAPYPCFLAMYLGTHILHRGLWHLDLRKA
jgi:hypothetical protein